MANDFKKGDRVRLTAAVMEKRAMTMPAGRQDAYRRRTGIIARVPRPKPRSRFGPLLGPLPAYRVLWDGTVSPQYHPRESLEKAG